MGNQEVASVQWLGIGQEPFCWRLHPKYPLDVPGAPSPCWRVRQEPTDEQPGRVPALTLLLVGMVKSW